MTEQIYQITNDKLPQPEEVEALLRFCRKKAASDLISGRKTWINRYLLVHLACGAGLRASEIALARTGDLDEFGEDDLLWVRRSEGLRHHQVNLGAGLAAHIKEYLQLRSTAWGEYSAPDDLLLPGRKCRPYSSSALSISFRRAVEESGLSCRFSLRNARHFYAAFLLAKTRDLCYVQRQLGHANQSMTVLYLDVAPNLDYHEAQAAIW
ncbi:tyrosine-type recombinase/integrase [Dethiosulfatarculus sandiegensis]|uniref:Tyr recombinase domain-containing protein n=1 Tax=Dethiosulfatarculus sandiegensis TaxID=1429043 RepID=A0A0D2J8H8_9BACT|nr:tyrosine-type recombinase/integrase [Dethiosulfatarculus sandiegensis]KIX14469.1 hypothetical protein X474_10315 [Dethiosulfatarculus sandiegensis]